jgi:peptide chain release factor subunit 1
LPGDVRARFIGSFVVDPHTMTPARVRELSAPVVANWVSQREDRLAAEILAEPPNGLTATGLNSCLAAVNQHAARVLVVPSEASSQGLPATRAAYSRARRADACMSHRQYTPSQTCSRR